MGKPYSPWTHDDAEAVDKLLTLRLNRLTTKELGFIEGTLSNLTPGIDAISKAQREWFEDIWRIKGPS